MYACHKTCKQRIHPGFETQSRDKPRPKTEVSVAPREALRLCILDFLKLNSSCGSLHLINSEACNSQTFKNIHLCQHTLRSSSLGTIAMSFYTMSQSNALNEDKFPWCISYLINISIPLSHQFHFIY